jgi:hypothetical protein
MKTRLALVISALFSVALVAAPTAVMGQGKFDDKGGKSAQGGKGGGKGGGAKAGPGNAKGGMAGAKKGSKAGSGGKGSGMKGGGMKGAGGKGGPASDKK